MEEISRHWQQIWQSQRKNYKKQAEELQKQHKEDLDHYVQSLSPEEYAAYRERTSGKHKNMDMSGGPEPKITTRTDVQSPSAGTLQEGLAQAQGLQAPEAESPEAARGSEENKEDGEKAEGSVSSDSSSGNENEECEDSNSSL